MDQETKSEFSAVNDRLDKLTDFLQKHMVTRQELSESLGELPTKADFAQLQTSVDGIAVSYKTTSEELVVAKARVSRMEDWIMKAAAKIGLDYRP